METQQTPYGQTHMNRTTKESALKPVPPDMHTVAPEMSMAETVNRRYDNEGRLLGPKE